MRTIAPAAVALATALALTGCNGNGDTTPSPTPAGPSTTAAPSPTDVASPTMSPTPPATPSPTRAPTPSATAAPSPTAAPVPDDLSTIADDGEVTVAEAQAVVDAQDEIYNNAVIQLLTRPNSVSGGTGRTFLDELAKVFNPPLRNGYGQAWNDAAQSGFENFDTDTPTGIDNTVDEVLSTTQECFYVRVTRDGNGLSRDQDPPKDYWVSIRNDGEKILDSPVGWHRDAETFEDPGPDVDYCQLAPLSP